MPRAAESVRPRAYGLADLDFDVKRLREETAAFAEREWVERRQVSGLELESPGIRRIDRAEAQFEPAGAVPLRVEVELRGTATRTLLAPGRTAVLG